MEGIEMLFVKLTKTFKVEGHRDTEHLDAHTDRVMEELLALESDTVTDADVSAELANGIVEVSIVVSGEDFDTAAQLADVCIRTAIHAAGGSTPDWKTIDFRAQELVPA